MISPFQLELVSPVMVIRVIHIHYFCYSKFFFCIHLLNFCSAFRDLYILKFVYREWMDVTYSAKLTAAIDERFVTAD